MMTARICTLAHETLPVDTSWHAGPMSQLGATWPFEWVADITGCNTASRHRQHIGQLRQPGSRPVGEARANLMAVALVPDMVRLLQAMNNVIAMRDPESETFADSAADCLDALCQQQAQLSRVLRLIRRDS